MDLTLTLSFEDWNRVLAALMNDGKIVGKDAATAFQQDAHDYAEVLWSEQHEIARLTETIRFELEANR